MSSAKELEINQTEEVKEDKLRCGIIMPISSNNQYSEEHWKNVLNIIKEAVERENKFISVPVWEKANADVIQSTIITNIFSCDIAICDLSSTNPNVMYELGLRMAVKKPIILIKDIETKPPFDINNIRYIEYPKELHYYKVQEFIKQLSNTMENEWNKYYKDTNNYNQLLEIGEYKKYIINGMGTNSETQTLEEAVNSIYRFIVDKSHDGRKQISSNRDFTELSSALWDMKTQQNKFKKEIDELFKKTKTKDGEDMPVEEIKEGIENLVTQYSLLSEGINAITPKIEELINE